MPRAHQHSSVFYSRATSPPSEAAVGNQPLLKSLNVEDTSLPSQEADNYKRGDRVFIEKDWQTTKAMVCEMTPQKKRVKVAVNP